jgi:hypothetical protein
VKPTGHDGWETTLLVSRRLRDRLQTEPVSEMGTGYRGCVIVGLIPRVAPARDRGTELTSFSKRNDWGRVVRSAPHVTVRTTSLGHAAHQSILRDQNWSPVDPRNCLPGSRKALWGEHHLVAYGQAPGRASHLQRQACRLRQLMPCLPLKVGCPPHSALARRSACHACPRVDLCPESLLLT